ncbi:TPA: hypothetical protein LC218_001435 [Salmonella enterica subsp. arizonae serovar 13,22:z4,z23:-]|uniref:Uncharacterized protein n=1 Tax=Salmonella enterica subsp. arizonae TaxID=59203 RepID=A0A8F7N496_SALER|nr:hypothetical protein DOE56_09545 [Salmonella enterica subsp. arizonae serovar 63:g,z51:-]EAN5160612.1 hypothetical protein [Salmonella enterica]EBU3310419.1 hypothetical protein [Salmonella enterica subsp. arizonae]KSB78532.1 hypothetical protein LFZ51_07735 [Salmonella enterica subsp. arizonae serovar 63:g,z51:- str. So 20/20]HBJ6279496.1 hypothetical protein [Salmonella enterica subsp. arizonae serovar 13,22:z4,z23:-]HCV7536963.1 hypothetical protein [Salmonella enterica subsp. arizonae s
MHHAATFILWVNLQLFDQKTTTAIFSAAYGILRRLNICYRTFSLKHNEENK